MNCFGKIIVPGSTVTAIGLKPNFLAKINGMKNKQPLICESSARKQARRSIVAFKDIKKGERITEENVRSIRPGYGLPPKYMDEVLGQRAVKDIMAGTPLAWEMIANF